MIRRGRLGSGTEIRRKILRAVERLHTFLGRWPMPREVSTDLKLPARTLRYHTRILEARRWIKRTLGYRMVELARPLPADDALLLAELEAQS